MHLSLNNRKDILADSVAVFKGNRTIDLLESLDSVTGLAPATLNSLEKLATALNNDSGYFTTVKNALDNKASLASPTFTGTATVNNLKVNASLYTDDPLGLMIGSSVSTIGSLTVNGNAMVFGPSAHLTHTIQNTQLGGYTSIYMESVSGA